MIDLSEASKFVAALTGDASTPCTWQTFDDTPDRRPWLATILHGPLASTAPELQRLNGLGAGVFLTVNRTDMRGRKEANIVGIRALFVDHDDGWPAEPWTPAPSIVVESANGPHAYWVVKEGTALEDFTPAQKWLIQRWGSDKGIHDKTRVMRVPGFMHNKGAPTSVTIAGINAAVYALADVVDVDALVAGGAELLPWSKPAAGRGGSSRGARPSAARDLRSLDVSSLFRSAGMMRRDLEVGKYAVVCPWNGSHTRPTDANNTTDTSTVAWDSTGGWPAFKCSHSHCDHRTIRDVIDWFGGDVIDAHCAREWISPADTELVAAAKAWREKARKDRREALAGAGVPDLERGIINTSQDLLIVRDQSAAALTSHPNVYVSGGKLARVGADRRVEHLTRGSLEDCLLDRSEFVIQMANGTLKPARALPDTVTRILMAPSPAIVRRFRQLDQITSTPFWTPGGRPVMDPGYSPEARTVLIAPPPVRADLWESGAHAIGWLADEMLEGFPWAGTGERANYLGALLVPMVRAMIPGPVPLLNIEASKRGSGKSLLATLIQLVYGLTPEVAPLPRDEAEVEKRILSILRSANPVHVWDNVRHSVESPAFEAVLTTDNYTGRLLGFSQDLRLPVKQLWIMTSNNARMSDDLSRRTTRVRLVPDTEHPEDRADFKHADIQGWCKANRPQILSALWQAVSEWIAAGMPAPAHGRTLGSYHRFAEVIGGILYHAGEFSFLANVAESRTELSTDAAEWHPFLATWWQARGRTPAKAKDLWHLCNDDDLMLSARGDRGESSQIKRLANAVRGKKDAIVSGFRVKLVRGASKGWLYQLETVH